MPLDSDDRTRTGETTARNIRAGRDFTQINNSINHPTPNAERVPATDTSPINSWPQFFVFLLKSSHITIPRLNTLFRASFFVSIAVLLGTLTAVIPNYTPVFSTGYPLAPSVFFPVLLSATLVIYVSKEYFLTREQTTCPSCESPFSLLPTDRTENHANPTDSHSHRERTVECVHCDYELTENATWKTPPRPRKPSS